MSILKQLHKDCKKNQSNKGVIALDDLKKAYNIMTTNELIEKCVEEFNKQGVSFKIFTNDPIKLKKLLKQLKEENRNHEPTRTSINPRLDTK